MLSVGLGPLCEQGVPPLPCKGGTPWANVEHASAEPEPVLSLSMSILAKSYDLGQMKSLDADALHLTLRISL